MTTKWIEEICQEINERFQAKWGFPVGFLKLGEIGKILYWAEKNPDG